MLEMQLHSLLGVNVMAPGAIGNPAVPIELLNAARAEDLEQMPLRDESATEEEPGVAATAEGAAPEPVAPPARSSKSTRRSPVDKRRGGNAGVRLRMSVAECERVSQAVEELYEAKRLSEAEATSRQATLQRLQRLMEETFPGRSPELHLFGSSVNGFGVSGCDMDMVLMVDGPQSELVEKVAAALTALQYPELLAIATARVPVVKFRDPATGLGCDICFNNGLALRNSGLLATYSALDPRVRPLAFAVKHWAKNRRVNTTFEGTLSSYAYVLMVIQFLQCRRAPVLPVLQDMTAGALRGRNRRKVMVSGFDTYYYASLDDKRLAEFGAKNSENVGRLLFEFFVFYGFSFRFKDKVISPRTGSVLSKEDKGWTQPVDKANKSNYWFCLEDPFEVTHNLGRTVDKGSLFNLRYEFRRAACILAGAFPWEEAYKDRPRGTLLEMLMTPFSKVEKSVKL